MPVMIKQMIKQIAPPFLSAAGAIRPLAPAALVLGIVIVLIACARLVFSEVRKPATEPQVSDEIPSERPKSPWHWLVPLLLLITMGAALRLVGLGEKSLNHMEVYIPGIPLPIGISEPP